MNLIKIIVNIIVITALYGGLLFSNLADIKWLEYIFIGYILLSLGLSVFKISDSLSSELLLYFDGEKFLNYTKLYKFFDYLSTTVLIGVLYYIGYEELTYVCLCYALFYDFIYEGKAIEMYHLVEEKQFEDKELKEMISNYRKQYIDKKESVD